MAAGAVPAERPGLIDLDIKKLRTLVAIAQEQSFTGAADRLNTSQPWISEQLKQLESLLQLPLIERVKGKFVQLTANGRELLPIAERLVTAWDEAGREIDLLRSKDRSRLTLGVDAVTLYMPQRNRLLADFMATMPGLDLQIVNDTPADLFEGLHDGRLDLVLTLCPAPDDQLEVLPLYDYELKLFVPRAAAQCEPATGQRVLILRDDYHPAFFAWLRAAFAPAGFEWVACAETSFHALLKHAVMLGIPTLSPDFSEQIPELAIDMASHSVGVPDPVTATWALMRLPGAHRRTANRLWSMVLASAPAHRSISVLAGHRSS